MDSTLALGAFRIARGAGGEAVREREPRRAGEGRLVWNGNSCFLIDYRLWAAKSEGRLGEPGDSDERAESRGQEAAADAGAPRQRTGANGRGAHARAAGGNQGYREPFEAADGSESANAEGCSADQAGSRLPAHDPRRGRNRHWQGTCCSGDPSAECPTQEAVYRRRLRRDPGYPDRVGTLRLRERRVHRRRSAKGGAIPAYRGRKPLSRRDYQSSPRHASEALARAAGTAGDAPRPQTGAPCETSGHPRPQCPPRARGAGGPVSPRSLLPP